jgi:hypothetical protein
MISSYDPFGFAQRRNSFYPLMNNSENQGIVEIAEFRLLPMTVNQMQQQVIYD